MTDGKHGGVTRKELAENNTILRVLVGSGAHGISVAGTDDRDEMGVCIEPPEYVIGLKKFEQYEHHTAWERKGGLANRSGPGDLDIVIYSLRKFMSLALKGNPSILVPFYTAEKDIVKITGLGVSLRALGPVIASKQAGFRFLGYLHSQRLRMLSNNGKGKDVTRPELVEKYGYDTKYAGHMVRLGIQGIEYMQHGRLTLPMPEPEKQTILDVRTGKFSMIEALDLCENIEDRLQHEISVSELPDHPDYAAVNDWLILAHRLAWSDLA